MTTATTATLANKEHRYIGKPVKRHDGFEKVTGQAQYAGDIKLSGMLYAKMKTSPHAHARILSIDASRARALPGVRSVITGEHGTAKVGIYMQDKSVIATDYVRYAGEVVAAVAADTLRIAEQAIELIEVEYEPLPALLDVCEAAAEGAPLIHPDLGSYAHSEGVFFPEPGTNIANHTRIRRGNMEAGFAEADIILENTFSQKQVFHVPLETHVTIVQWALDDQIKIWCSGQSPFSVRDLFAIGFEIDRNKIEVNIPFVGGGFGGKAGIHLEPLVGLLSRAAGGRPVKLVPTREEECATLPCRQGQFARIKTGCKKDGTIVAEAVEILWDAGAYADYGVNIGRASSTSACGPYYIPNVCIDAKTVYTNKLFGTAYRGFGHPECFFAIERQRDLMARELGMDPTDFRLKNMLYPGLTTVTGELVTENTGRPDKCLKSAARMIDLHTPYTEAEKAEMRLSGKYRAKAACVLQKAPAMPTWSASSALVQMNEDGSVRISVSGVDYGQGTYTVLQQIVAERLNLPIEKVNINRSVNTTLSPYDWQTVASRMTVICGMAVADAADDLKRQTLEIAAIALRASVHEIALGEGYVYVMQNPHLRVGFDKLAIGYVYENGNAIGGPLIGRGRAIAQGLSNLDPETGQGKAAIDWTYGAHAVELEVDTNTGDIEVLQFANCLDVGQVMNEQLLRGQTVGGILQGIGCALSEAVNYNDQGKMITNNFTDYKIPTFKDMPGEIKLDVVQTPQLDGPYGARGAGEHPLISVTAVIANALANATGAQFHDLPLSATRVHAKLEELREGQVNEIAEGMENFEPTACTA
ncbi:MAG: xanthine dehydrogenase family protein molybdopterin-binding subunit [Coriobacteriales bacterium]|jgi:CO/xanthine dehydrogenase Mo-binding subunit|nr:xanthine dehydrogenase family protein molybdopterin-binding subunit [Coriobacteriales bacterium]